MDYMTAREASEKWGHHAAQSPSFMRSREDTQRRSIWKRLGDTKRCCEAERWQIQEKF